MLGAHRILIIEDDLSIVEMLRNAFRSEGFLIDAAADGMEVRLTAKEFDILKLFATNKNRVFTKSLLADLVVSLLLLLVNRQYEIQKKLPSLVASLPRI